MSNREIVAYVLTAILLIGGMVWATPSGPDPLPDPHHMARVR